MKEKAGSNLESKITLLTKDYFIGEEGTTYGGYYDYCIKFLKTVDEFQENVIPDLDLADIENGIEIPQAGSLKNAGATMLPFYKAPYYRGGLDWRNVLPGTAIPGIIFSQAVKITNSNLVLSKYGGKASELEVRASSTMAKLVGFDPKKSAGIFVEAGTKANLYGYVLGLRKTLPDIAKTGIMNLGKKVCFINSQAGHFSNLTNLALMGVGINNTIPIPVDENFSINLPKLEETLMSLHKDGVIVPTILITVGTTDTFGVDDVKGVYEIREKIFKDCDYKPHIHADAAIGWSMVFFNDYDFNKNVHGFDNYTLSKLRDNQELFRNLRYADSITLDFHKTGYTPYSSSMVLIKNRKDLQALHWNPKMFKYFNPEEIEIAPVQYTFECTRNPEGVFSIAGNLLAFGIEGYQICLGWVIQVSNYLRKRLKELGNVGIINPNNNGFSTVFRVYPPGVNGELEINKEVNDAGYKNKLHENTKYSKGLFEYVNNAITAADAKIDWTHAANWATYDYMTEIPGWKAYILNPRVTYKMVDDFIKTLELMKTIE